MKKLLVGSAMIAVLILASVLAFWAGTRNAGGKPAEGPVAAAPVKAAPPGIVVEASKVQVVSLPQALTAVGSLRSDETIIVRPEVAGRIAQIHFREGEPVRKGALLISLDASVQKADLDRARANLSLSKSKFDRAEDLRTKGFLSSQAKDEAENNLRVAQADAELMEARFAKSQIRAPFSGVIGLRQVSVGDYVKEGQDIVNLEAVDPLKVDFRIPEVVQSQVKDNQNLQITLDAIPDKAFNGRVFAINPAIDANGRAIVIRAEVPNRDGKLRPGMFARIRLFTSGNQETVVVPEEALFPVGEEKYVYKVVDGKATRQKIAIGARRDGKVEVMNGLTKDDVVVTAGVIKLREGASVKIANAPAAAPPPATTNSTAPNKPKG